MRCDVLAWANGKGANGPVPTEYVPPQAIQVRARCEVGFGERMTIPEFTDIRRTVEGPTKAGHFPLSSFIPGNLRLVCYGSGGARRTG